MAIEIPSLAERITGRQRGESLFAMLVEDANSIHPVARAAFWEAISSGLCDMLPPAPEPEQPKLEPIARLGATTMPFGQHEGKSFDDIPLRYLDWLCNIQEDFYKSLRAYLTHPDLASRRLHE